MATKKYLKKVETNVGEITYIDISRKNRPVGLKKPYEYILSISQMKAFLDALNGYLKPLEKMIVPYSLNPHEDESKKYQHAAIWKKSVNLGIRFHLFILAYSPNVKQKEWKTVCRDVQKIIYDYLGKDAQIYSEPFNKDGKFQARFETYIAYKEMLSEN